MALGKRIPRVLLEHKWRYLGLLFIVVLSSAALTMMSLFAGNFERLVHEFEVDHAQEHVSFRIAGDPGDLDELEAAANATIERTPVLDAPIAGGKTLHLRARSHEVNIPAIVEGRDLQARGEVLVSPMFASANGIEVGDSIELFGRSFRIVGFAALPNFIYPIESETDMMPTPSFGIAILDHADLAALGQPPRTVYAARFEQGDQPIRERSIALRRMLEARGVEILEWINIEDNKRVNIVTAEVKILGLVSTGVPTAILLLACVMVAAVVRRMINQDSAVIGALYALGYRRREIHRHYLMYPLMLAVAGGVIGTLLGLLPVRPWLEFFLQSFTVPLTGVELMPGRLAINLLVPVVMLAASGYFAVRGKLRRPAAELMKGSREGTRVNPLERALKLERLGFRARFKLREQLRSPSRSAMLLGGIAVATVLMQWGFSLQSSMDFLLTGTSDVYKFTYEYKFDRLRTEPLPDGAEPFSAALFLPEGEQSRDFYVTGILPDSKMIALADEAGDRLLADQVVITKSLARILDATPGDQVAIVRKLDGKKYTITIDAIADTYAGSFMYMPLQQFNAMFEMPANSYVGAFSRVPLELPAGTAYSMTTMDDKIEGAQSVIDSVKGLTATLAFMAFVIGLVMVYVVTTLLVEENRQTISLMKILGYRLAEIDALVLSSSTVTVVLGYALGIPLTRAALGVLIESLETSVGLVVPRVSIGVVPILVGFVIVMLSYWISKRVCRRRVDAIPMHEALGAE